MSLFLTKTILPDAKSFTQDWKFFFNLGIFSLKAFDQFFFETPVI